jgi:hypothetical protein
MKWGPSWNHQPNLFLYISWTGILVVLLSFWRKKLQKTDWFLLGMITCAVIYSFGSHVPGFEALQQLPMFRQSRGITLILMIPALLLPILVSRALVQNAAYFVQLKIKRSIVIGCTSIALILFLWWLVVTNFSYLWQMTDSITRGKLSASEFHTLARDEVIIRLFFQNLMIVLTTTVASIFFLHKKKPAVVAVVVGLELLYFTSAHYRFGPVSAYSLATASPAFDLLKKADIQQYRLLTRNYNAPYSDFGFYNDSLSVRAPFTDSFIDERELKDFTVLQKMRDGLTPDWNIAANVPVIHGYTTLLPQSLHQIFWNQGQDPRINTLPHIPTSHPGLALWATKYYLVDTWFPDYGEVFPKKLLGGEGRWLLFELPDTLSRFRDTAGHSLQLRDFLEQPNRISFSTQVASASGLIVADRYDKDWRVTVNGVETELENFQGMRRFTVPGGEITVDMWYEPTWFYRGLLISGLTVLGLITYLTGRVSIKRR